MERRRSPARTRVALAGRQVSGPILAAMTLRDGEPIYFYELHEGDDEVFSDTLLAHDAEYDDGEFLELVLEARSAVIDRYEEDTLSEAIARHLADTHGFLVIDDSQLRVAVNVSTQEGETFVAAVEAGAPGGEADESETDYRSLVLDVDPEDHRWANN
jgi:hypothetical protein